MKILVTGAAGFIGFHLTKELSKIGVHIVGLDNLNDYYDVNLKYDRLKELGIKNDKVKYNEYIQSTIYKELKFIKLDLLDFARLKQMFVDNSFDIVINLAAQAGVRYSLINPQEYINSNVNGFLNVLENCRSFAISHCIYASSSSVYGLNRKFPFSVHDATSHPVSLYAATKKANELMAHTYSYLFRIPTTGLRFFTVYGPWGRPDMAPISFAKAICENRPINVYNNGDMQRDFTYIDDIISGIIKVVYNPPTINPDWSGEDPDPGTSLAPYRIYNLGNNLPVNLLEFIQYLEQAIGKKANINYLPLQPGDIIKTAADITDIKKDLEYKPQIDIKVGTKKFIDWFKMYYKIENNLNQ